LSFFDFKDCKDLKHFIAAILTFRLLAAALYSLASDGTSGFMENSGISQASWLCMWSNSPPTHILLIKFAIGVCARAHDSNASSYLTQKSTS